MEAGNLISTITALLIGIPAAAHAAPSFTVCYGFECGRQQQVSLTPSQWRDIRALFTPHAADAGQERILIRRAIAQMETLAGASTGTRMDSGEPPYIQCLEDWKAKKKIEQPV